MTTEQPRELTGTELEVLQMMVEASSYAEDLMRQISGSQVRSLDSYGSLEFSLGNETPIPLPDGPALNAIQPDTDTVDDFGPYINYVLFIKSGYIRELQIYRDDGGPIRSKIDPTRITSIYPGRP